MGVYHKQLNIVQKIKLPPETSIFTGECFGILKSLEYILLLKLKNALIITDSLSALQALAKFPFKSKNIYPPIIQIRNLINKCIVKGLEIIFIWIPSHRGIVGNEKADVLANSAIECGDIFPYKNYCYDLATLPRLFLQKSWSELWTTSGRIKGKYYCSIQPTIRSKPWFQTEEFDKLAVTSLIRMRLGHLCIPEHLARINIFDNNECICKKDIGDINHLFFSCENYDHTPFFGTFAILKNSISHIHSKPSCF